MIFLRAYGEDGPTIIEERGSLKFSAPNEEMKNLGLDVFYIIRTTGHIFGRFGFGGQCERHR